MKHLWSKIIRRADDSRRAFVCFSKDLADAKVGEFDVAMLVDEYVLWFEVAIDDTPTMQVLDCEDKLCSVEASFLLAEITFAGDEHKKVTTIDKIGNEIQVRLSLECVMQAEKERMFHRK